jgi:hypothetical protein
MRDKKPAVAGFFVPHCPRPVSKYYMMSVIHLTGARIFSRAAGGS